MVKKIGGMVLVLLVVGLAACQAAGNAPTPATGGAESVFLGNCGEASGPLHLYIWFDEVVPEVLEQFATRYGIEVSHDTYTSNDELLETLKNEPAKYDLVFPSSYAVQTMIAQGMARTLDKENIPNRQNLTTVLAYYHDPSNHYSLPYQWGTTGIAYNSKFIETPPDSWAYLFDPELAGEYAGKFTMLDAPRPSLGAALIYLGYSLNDSDLAHLEEAKALLLAQKPLVARYDSSTFGTALENEEIYLAHAWSGPAAVAASKNDAIRYVIPKEGGAIWMDNMVIPIEAKNPCTAELLINYLLDPKVAAQISSHTFYNSPVSGASRFFTAEAQEVMSRGFAIDNDTINRLEWMEEGDDPTLYTEVWTEIVQP